MSDINKIVLPPSGKGISIIRHRGDVQEADTHRGEHVTREEKLWVDQDHVWINCAPYDNHFIYRSHKPNQSAYMCTCGSPAVIVEVNELTKENLFVCLYHHTTKGHQTGERTWQ